MDGFSDLLRPLIAVCKWLFLQLRRVWNLVRRPNLQPVVCNSHITFTDSQRDYDPSFPTIRVSNSSDEEVVIDLNKSFLGDEKLTSLISDIRYYKLTLNGTLETANPVLALVKEKWGGDSIYRLDSHESLEIPISANLRSGFWFVESKDARVFLPNHRNKLVLQVFIDSNLYHYTLDRNSLLRKVIEHLTTQIKLDVELFN